MTLLWAHSPATRGMSVHKPHQVARKTDKITTQILRQKIIELNSGKNTNENFLEHKPGAGFFIFFVSHCFHLKIEYILGFGGVHVVRQTFWDIFVQLQRSHKMVDWRIATR